MFVFICCVLRTDRQLSEQHSLAAICFYWFTTDWTVVALPFPFLLNFCGLRSFSIVQLVRTPQQSGTSFPSLYKVVSGKCAISTQHQIKCPKTNLSSVTLICHQTDTCINVMCVDNNESFIRFLFSLFHRASEKRMFTHSSNKIDSTLFIPLEGSLQEIKIFKSSVISNLFFLYGISFIYFYVIFQVLSFIFFFIYMGLYLFIY